MKKNIFTLEIFLSFLQITIGVRETFYSSSLITESLDDDNIFSRNYHRSDRKKQTVLGQIRKYFILFFFSATRRLKTCTSNTTTREILKWDLNEKALEYHFCVPNCLRVSERSFDSVSRSQTFS